MTPEAEQLLDEILINIINACYSTMGEEWVKKMLKKVDELKYIGTP